MCRTHGRGLPEWIRFRRNQNPAVAATPARNTPNALRRTPLGTRKTTPTAIAVVAPDTVNLLPSAIPIASPATRSAPTWGGVGGAAAGTPTEPRAESRTALPLIGDRSPADAPPAPAPVAPDFRVAQALMRTATAARSIATGT